MYIPAKLKEFVAQADAGLWLEALPNVVSELAVMWELDIGDAYPDCGVSYVTPAERRGLPVVLKIQWPHEECRFEAQALRYWNGDGAVKLLEADSTRHSMLLERCDPGVHLADAPTTDPIGIMIDLLPRLWKTAAGPFKLLSEEARDWQSNLYSNWQMDGAACEKSLIDSAYSIITELVDSQGEQVLVHQDLHGDNVLSSKRSGWLAIDPKPIIGEREFALSPIIRSFEFGKAEADLVYRLDRLASELLLDRERVCGWAIVQSIAWSFGGDHAAQHHQTARWLLSAR